MKSIESMKIALNKKAEVVLLTDIHMKSDKDIDSLFLNFFTLMNPPLRLSVLGVGCLSREIGVLMGLTESQMNQMLQDKPEVYTNILQQKTEELLQNGEEYAKINLDNEDSAKNVRAILTSMISNGYYIQRIKYHFPSGVQKQDQKVDISQLKPAFMQMLEIAKRWNDESFLEELQ